MIGKNTVSYTDSVATMPATVVVSNRGPISYSSRPDGSLVAKRGGGGLVSGLAPVVAVTDTVWLAAALTDDDRSAARGAATNGGGNDSGDGGDVKGHRFVVIEPDVLELAYDTVSNGVLWFLHHGLGDLSRGPSFDRNWSVAWEAFRAYNQAFADVLADLAEPNAPVLVQDFHLCLLAPLLAARRPDLRLVHFSHTPFARPDWLFVLPEQARHDLMTAMVAFTACGFHCRRWEQEFLASCRASRVTAPPTFVSALGPDAADLLAVAGSPEATHAGDELDGLAGGRSLLVRVDRMELSKNVLRGFQAFDELLATRADLRERVCFAAALYPSREALATYRDYRDEVLQIVDAVNDRWGRGDWTPILLQRTDDFPRSVASLARADVLVVNPIRDGMNLVAKEGPIVNGRSGQLVLSTETGAWDEMGAAAYGVNPFDVTATAQAMADAFDLEQPQRSARAERLRHAALARQPRHWFDDQLAAARSTK